MEQSPIPDRSFKEMLKLYDGRRPEATQDSEAEQEVLELPDTLDTTKRMGDLAQIAAKKFDVTTVDDWGWNADYGDEGHIKRTPLACGVVDESVPLSFVALRSFNGLASRRSDAPQLDFYLMKGSVSMDDLKAVPDQWLKDERVGSMTYSCQGNDMHLADRFILPKYRSQDFGSMLFQASEGFIQQYADDKQQEYRIPSSAQSHLES